MRLGDASRYCMVAVGAILVLTTARTVTAQGGHGVGLAAICEDGLCAGETTFCRFVLSYNDQFGDTTAIISAFDVVDPLGSAVRVPAVGNLEILEAVGNTTAVPGPFTADPHRSRR